MPAIESFHGHFVETESQEFLRLGPDNWYVRMGESWEPCYEEEEELERMFEAAIEAAIEAEQEKVLHLLEKCGKMFSDA